MKANEPVAERIAACRLVAVLVMDREEDAVPVAEALLAGGVRAMELTLRTPAALPALQRIRAEVPEMLAGIGTVLTVDQVDQVEQAGGAFAVSPGVNPAVIEAAAARGLPFAPGIMTPSDIEAALAQGCEVLKFFPAGSSGGLAHLKNIAAPYAHLGLRYIPLGGISANNMREYLGADIVSAIGGSWLASRDMIAAGEWKRIKENAQEAIQLAGPHEES